MGELSAGQSTGGLVRESEASEVLGLLFRAWDAIGHEPSAVCVPNATIKDGEIHVLLASGRAIKLRVEVERDDDAQGPWGSP